MEEILKKILKEIQKTNKLLESIDEKFIDTVEEFEEETNVRRTLS